MKISFEDKTVVKPYLLVSYSVYVFALSTLECVQFQTLRVEENVQFDVKTCNAHFREQQLPFKGGCLNAIIKNICSRF